MKTFDCKIENRNIEKRAFINGNFVSALDGKTINKTCSANGYDISGLAACKQADINNAVQSAKEAFISQIWVEKDPSEKKSIMLKLANLMEQNKDDLAMLDTIETGRAFKNYYFDSIPKAIEVVRWYAESIDKVYDHSILPRANEFATITREPLGVVGCITPWNDPLVPAMWKMSPALLMGNSVVMKPAEQSSFSLLKVAQLAKEAGIPNGVLNVVPGYGEEAGKALALHPDVAGIFFTGSSEIGKRILQYAGLSNMKRVALECGGKSPFIVSKKCANLKDAAQVLAKNIFYNQGQICSAPSRLIIQKEIKSEFLNFLINEAKKYFPGDPFNPDTEVGCLINYEQKNKIENYIKNAIRDGAKSIIQFEAKNIPACSILPTILDNVKPDSQIAQEEVFGPVLIIQDFNDIKEAIKIGNNSKYGLAGAVWTNDLDEAYHITRSLQVGTVHINSYGDDDITVPFGGIKESGIGKDKSIFAFNEYCNLKTTWMKFKSI